MNCYLTPEQIRWACLAAAIIKRAEDEGDHDFVNTPWGQTLQQMVKIALDKEGRHLEALGE